jgi:TetR/AcrR family transcriptional repressor of nem operon
MPPHEAIVAFFGEIVERSVTDRRRKGCMLVNSTLEHVPEDRDFQQIVTTFLSDVEAFFLRCLASGQRDGTVSVSQSAEDLARMLLGQLLGIRVLARVKPDRSLLEGMLRPIFAFVFIESPRSNRKRSN